MPPSSIYQRTLKMKMSPEAYLSWENKAVTLLGMSGVGKTTLANKLPRTSWFHYSGDYRIGTRYLGEAILDNIKKHAMGCEFLRDLLCSDAIYICNNITIENLEPLSPFIGKLGDPARGGLPLDEFVRRQRQHHEAEVAAMRDVPDFIAKARDIYGYSHFINDAGGSVCELDDPATIECLARHTLLLYIRPSDDMEQEFVRRTMAHPKPMYYEEAFLRRNLDEYLEQEGLRSPEEVDPNGFVQWIFPRLIAHRRPVYEAIADGFGYSIDAASIEQVRDEADFHDLVASAIRTRIHQAA